MPVKKRSTNNENGFALLFAMLALLLMASIGLAMVYAADTETSIDSNYKDQTRATYAAYSALEEAKDRLRQGCGTSTTCTAIHWPTNIPKPTGSGTGYTNIIYIINPKTGETVKPWDPNNAYYDWEICDTTNENFPNSFCSTGMPSSASAYTIYCNGTSTACAASAGSNYNLLTSTVNAPWQRSVPLDYKWIRINLKTETMLYNAATSTGYPVGASTSSNTVVCWDGHGELAPGSGYNTDCTPNTALGVTLAAPGGGWTGVPTVTLGAPDVGGGTQATVTVNTTTTPNVLSSATVVTNGTGYTSNPTVTLVDPGTAPTTAGVITAHAVPVGAALTSLAVATGGVGTNTAPCFAGSSTPTVSITGGGGSGASATATMSGLTCLASVSVAGSCSGANFKSVTITGIPVSGGTGSGGVMSLTFNASDTVVGAAITTGGSGYTSNSGLGIATGSGSPNAMTNGCEQSFCIVHGWSAAFELDDWRGRRGLYRYAGERELDLHQRLPFGQLQPSGLQRRNADCELRSGNAGGECRTD